ncbi:MAG: aminoacyl-tRNA hydrolase [Pseudomonadota bacterium]
MLLLVGLGNPGPAYAEHRHNIGRMALDAIAGRHSFGPWRSRFASRTAEGRLGQERVVALKPSTFMNESGQAVAAAARFYKLAGARVIVLHDDLDLAPGKLRVKRGGGSAGHHGLRSIDAHLGPDYWRVRLGIGHPGDRDQVSDYVLHDFAKAERDWRDRLIEAVAQWIVLLAEGDEAGFMNRVALATRPPRARKPPPAPAPSGPAPEV